MRIIALIAAAFAALPAAGQTTTTVTTQSQEDAPPPPPQPRTRVTVDPDTTLIETRRPQRAPIAVIATDSLYGGLAGVLVGGGVTLIDQGNHWERDLSIGAGVGIIAGAAYGIYEVASSSSSDRVMHAAADRNPAASNIGFALPVGSRRF